MNEWQQAQADIRALTALCGTLGEQIVGIELTLMTLVQALSAQQTLDRKALAEDFENFLATHTQAPESAIAHAERFLASLHSGALAQATGLQSLSTTVRDLASGKISMEQAAEQARGPTPPKTGGDAGIPPDR